MNSQHIKNVRAVHIRNALAALNTLRGTSGHGAVGHHRYADIKGDGTNTVRVYVVVNENGGVSYSNLNGRTKRITLQNIEARIADVRHVQTVNALRDALRSVLPLARQFVDDWREDAKQDEDCDDAFEDRARAYAASLNVANAEKLIEG